VEKVLGLQTQLELHERLMAGLLLTSPISGRVVTWDVDQLLSGRPVQRGAVLLNVAQPEGAWEVELQMPEDRMGHVERARIAQGRELPVRFVLATDPGTTLQGVVQEIEHGAEVRGAEGSTVLVHVAFDQRELASPRYGAEVVARVHCGRRSLGYVWLHDVWAFVQKRILFRW
jgi:hypothetical protein